MWMCKKEYCKTNLMWPLMTCMKILILIISFDKIGIKTKNQKIFYKLKSQNKSNFMWPPMTSEDMLYSMKNCVFTMLTFISCFDTFWNKIYNTEEKVNWLTKRSSYVTLNGIGLWGHTSFYEKCASS